MRILIDAMGGDHAPEAIVKGAIDAAAEFGVQIVLVGRGEAILKSLTTLGLDTLPAGTFVEALSGGAWLYRVQGGLLPTAYTVTDLYGDERNYTVEWQMTPPQAEGYALVEVTDGNLADYPSVETPGWYYLLEETKTFRITVRQGGQAGRDGLLGGHAAEHRPGETAQVPRRAAQQPP